jgi:hypothetical protein
VFHIGYAGKGLIKVHFDDEWHFVKDLNVNVPTFSSFQRIVDFPGFTMSGYANEFIILGETMTIN